MSFQKMAIRIPKNRITFLKQFPIKFNDTRIILIVSYQFFQAFAQPSSMTLQSRATFSATRRLPLIYGSRQSRPSSRVCEANNMVSKRTRPVGPVERFGIGQGRHLLQVLAHSPNLPAEPQVPDPAGTRTEERLKATPACRRTRWFYRLGRCRGRDPSR